MRPVVQSMKYVVNYAEASRSASTNVSFTASTGKDLISAGQGSAVGRDVPTGSIIKYIEFQYVAVNLVAVALFIHSAIQLTRSSQAVIDPRVVGGDDQRNQVFHQDLFSCGKEQNVNRVYKFRVPKSFQRVREGDNWTLVTNGSQIHTSACQIIYKYYR